MRNRGGRRPHSSVSRVSRVRPPRRPSFLQTARARCISIDGVQRHERHRLQKQREGSARRASSHLPYPAQVSRRRRNGCAGGDLNTGSSNHDSPTVSLRRRDRAEPVDCKKASKTALRADRRSRSKGRTSRRLSVAKSRAGRCPRKPFECLERFTFMPLKRDARGCAIRCICVRSMLITDAGRNLHSPSLPAPPSCMSSTWLA
jgi:hypothetical protein